MMKSKYKLDDILVLILIASIIVFFASAAFDIYVRSRSDGSSSSKFPIVASVTAFVAFLLLFTRKKHSSALFINPSKGNAKSDFEFLLSTKDAMEAEIIKQLLAANGINAILRREVAGSFGVGLNAYAKAYLGQSSYLFGVLNIYVKAKDFEKAKNIIEERLSKDKRRQR
jgi:hypothetical protein